jgi:hypothetical protein
MSVTQSSGTSVSVARLGEIAHRLAAALAPRAIYLFGSQAYGTPTPDSDIDLLIVIGDQDELSVDYLKRAYGCLRGSYLPIELHFRSQTQFQRRSSVPTSLEHDVLSQGRALYAA